MSKETVWDADEDDFARELVGHKIVAITDAAIILDNGTTLVMEDTSNCCAHFGIRDVRVVGGVADNIVTAVTSRVLPDSEYGDGFTIVVLSEATELASIDIDGTASSGYYCHSINLSVSRAARGEDGAQ